MPETHAMQRARERYGIEISRREMGRIARRCFSGEGLVGHLAGGAQHHMIIVGERVLWVVYRKPSPGVRSPIGVVVTIHPPEVATLQAKHDHRHMRRRKGWK